MMLVLKINNLETITQVKKELNFLYKWKTTDDSESELVEIRVSVGALSTSEFLEPSYEFNPETSIDFKFFPQEISESISEKELEQSEFLMGLIDDLIFDELREIEYKNRGFSKRANDVDWSNFENTILESPSLDSLYHKIKHDEDWSENRKVALYKILLHSERIQDIDNVYDFIDNFFEIKFADIILKYPLKKEYVDKILNDPNINPITLLEYNEKHQELDSVENIIKTKDSAIIESYYFKLTKRSVDPYVNINHELMSLLKCPETPESVITAILFKTEMPFIYDLVLPHPNCPMKVIEHHLSIPAYGISLIKNPHINSELIDKMVDNFLAYDKKEEFLKLVLAHPNTLNITKEKITKKQAMLENFNEDLSSENLYKMINNVDLRFNLDEINEYAKKLKKVNEISDDTISLIEESIQDAWKKINRSINLPQVLKEYHSWNVEKTTTFINYQASEEACREIYKEEISKSADLIQESPIMHEISKKHDNLLKFTLREQVVNKLKDQAQDPASALQLADQIINNVLFLNNKFSLSAKEKQEIINHLIENHNLNEEIKNKLIAAS